MRLRESLGPNGFKVTRRNMMAISSLLAASFLEGCHVETLRRDYFRQYDHDHEPNCYLQSTQILTDNGYKKIEEVEIGERVITENHSRRRILWIGRRCCLRGPGGAWTHDVKPVKIALSAFGDKSPNADLFVSQGHRIYLHDMLIRAVDLVNGDTVSIVNGNDLDQIAYFHLLVEGGHCIIYAQNTPSESLLFDEKAVRRFDNWSSSVFESLSRSDGVPDTTCAPLFTCNDFGGRARLRSHLRSALSPWIDRRSQSDKARDHLMDGQYGTMRVPGRALAAIAVI